MARFERVLVVAAHPDDEIACAGTLDRLASEGSRITLVAFSDCTDLNGPAIVDEWRVAVELLGCEAELANYPNRHLPDHRQAILGELAHAGPYDVVFAPATFDQHQDHATVSAEAIRAFKRTTILGYEHPQNTVRASQLAAYVKLNDIGPKLAHCARYGSQAGKPYMDPRVIEGLARLRGMQCGAEFAEAFEVIRWVM